ncbi:MAG: 3,5-cyclic-AMP phosphodiesterase [Actinomycetota bacterium]|jgi:predicted phosphodiesterase
MAPELTTVSENTAVVFDGTIVHRYDGLPSDSDFEFDGVAGRTLARPHGELLCRVATVNDVHFGETECGMIEGLDIGPVLSAEPGERPYPDVMNEAAATEIKAIDPAAVVAKGDLTTRGIRAEYDQFLACYGTAFGDKLVHVRGNHDGYYGETFAAEAPIEVALPGVTLAVLDTVIPRQTPGQITDATAEWLDELAARTEQRVLVFGHHHVWSPTSRTREPTYFGINPDDSEKLIDVFVRRPNLVGYFAGHTHRNRVRQMPSTAQVPWVEVSATKDFPGAWAEYRVFEGGILQVMHRISAPDALDWTERTRAMFGGLYPTYSFGQIEDRCFGVTA